MLSNEAAVSEIDQIPHKLKKASVWKTVEWVPMRHLVSELGQGGFRFTCQLTDNAAVAAHGNRQLCINQAVVLNEVFEQCCKRSLVLRNLTSMAAKQCKFQSRQRNQFAGFDQLRIDPAEQIQLLRPSVLQAHNRWDADV